VFRREVLAGVEVKSNRFGFEPEITAKIAKHKWRIYEVPITYAGRTYEEGKKITWKDGVQRCGALSATSSVTNLDRRAVRIPVGVFQLPRPG